MRFPERGLYAITQTENKSGDTIINEVIAAIRGGAVLVQYRDKNPADAFFLARELVKICHQHNVPLIINDDIDLAARVGADGVHIGKEDGAVAQARKRLGDDAIIGVSCYNFVERALDAQGQGATYVAFGRFFPSSSKPLAAPAKIETLQQAKLLLNIPIVAIGGILPENGAQLLAAGADLLAVIGGLFDSQPEQSARAYQALFNCQTPAPYMHNPEPSCTDIYEPGLISVKDALSRILSDVPVISGYERLNIEMARARSLYEPVIAAFNVPAFTNSAVDGYAMRSSDLPVQGKCRLEICGQAFAGKPYNGAIKSGQCLRIMTGAPVPEGLDVVVMQEHAVLGDNVIEIDASHKAGQNIRKAGEDIQQGQTILHPGKFLTPPDIGLMASLGITEINVSRKLNIAIASTGNEVFSLGTTPCAGGIYDSNRYSLLAAMDRPDVDVINMGILEDEPASLLKSFHEASAYADVIISTGGVSVGEADYTKAALQASGQIEFWKVAIKPGRPLAFGNINNAAFFGLPGNPVAVMVTFYQFVLPALEKMSGITNKPIAPVFLARTTQNLRKKPGRTEILRGIIEQDDRGDWTVKTTGQQGSGILSSMSLANVFIILDHESSSIKAGEWVKVQPFAGLF